MSRRETHAKSPNSSSGKYFAFEEGDSSFFDPEIPANDGKVQHHDAGSIPNITVSTGWNGRHILLLFNGILSTCWGIALLVFAWPGGILPAPDGWVGQHPAITNTIVALVATLSTIHITYIMQRMVEEYSLYRMVRGFTMPQLRWMYGVQTRSFFTNFSVGSNHRRFCGDFGTKKLLWIVMYAGFAIHTSSIVSIFQIGKHRSLFHLRPFVPNARSKTQSQS